jgi:hypothetical protein
VLWDVVKMEASTIETSSFTLDKQGVFEQIYRFWQQASQDVSDRLLNEAVKQEEREHWENVVQNVTRLHHNQREIWLKQYALNSEYKYLIEQPRHQQYRFQQLQKMLSEEYRNHLIPHVEQIYFDSKLLNKLLQPKQTIEWKSSLESAKSAQIAQKDIHFSDKDVEIIELFESSLSSDEASKHAPYNKKAVERQELYNKILQWLEMKKEYEKEKLKSVNKVIEVNVFNLRRQLCNLHHERVKYQKIKTLWGHLENNAILLFENFYSDYNTFLATPRRHLSLNLIKFSRMSKQSSFINSILKRLHPFIDFSAMSQALYFLKGSDSSFKQQHVQYLIDITLQLHNRIGIKSAIDTNAHKTNFFILIYIIVELQQQSQFWVDINNDQQHLFHIIRSLSQKFISSEKDLHHLLHRQLLADDLTNQIEIFINEMTKNSITKNQKNRTDYFIELILKFETIETKLSRKIEDISKKHRILCANKWKRYELQCYESVCLEYLTSTPIRADIKYNWSFEPTDFQALWNIEKKMTNGKLVSNLILIHTYSELKTILKSSHIDTISWEEMEEERSEIALEYDMYTYLSMYTLLWSLLYLIKPLKLKAKSFLYQFTSDVRNAQDVYIKLSSNNNVNDTILCNELINVLVRAWSAITNECKMNLGMDSIVMRFARIVEEAVYNCERHVNKQQ